MKMSAKLLVLASIAGGFALSNGALAHGIWFAQRATQLAIIYGVGADDLDSVKRQPLFKSVGAYDQAGKPIGAKFRVDGPLLLVETESKPTLVTAMLDNGVWAKDKEGEWHKKGRDEMPDAVIVEKTVKYSVTIQGPLGGPVPAIADQVLQVVPVDAKLPEQAGKPVKLRVLYKGQPVKGAEVIADFVNDPDAKPVLSGSDGTVTLKVRNQGLNVVAATYRAASDEPQKFDRYEHRATLCFTLAHAPE